MVKDHSDSDSGNLLPPLHGLLFPMSTNGSFMHHPTDRMAHTTAFCYTSRGALAGMKNSSMGMCLKAL